LKVEDQLLLILSKLEQQTKGINEGNRRINDVQVSIDDLKAARDDFDRWQPQVNNKVVDLSSGLDSLRIQVDALQSASKATSPVLGEGFVYTKTPGFAHLNPPSSKAA
jgi:chromosome segregation ATPase